MRRTVIGKQVIEGPAFERFSVPSYKLWGMKEVGLLRAEIDIKWGYIPAR